MTPPDDPAPPPALAVAGVAKSYGSLGVLGGVGLEVAPGEAVGVVGPNGAGKTTLLDIAAGVQRCDAGRVLLGGRDVTRRTVAERGRMGLGRTFQVPRPFGELTVFENVLVGAVRAGGLRGSAAYDAAYGALETAGIAGLANETAGGLRLLDRKQLELARALAMRPRVLLLDEIAGGLTEPEADALVEAVRRIAGQGTAVLWVEHVIRVLVRVVSRLVCLADGAVLADGAPADVLRDPAVQAAYLGGELL